MSQIDDHRADVFQLLAEAHGTAQHTPAADSVLPSGARWISHQPKPGPLPPRKRAPSSLFADLFIS